VAGHQQQTPLKLRCRTIAKVQELCIVNGWAMPDHLVIQSDNTTAQAKNDETLVFLTLLVLRQRFQTATLNFLMPGHTHEDVDQLFGLVTAWMLQLPCFNSPADVLEHLHSRLQTKLVGQAAVACCEHLAAVHDFKGWLEPLGLHFCDALRNRGGVVTPHSFMFKPRALLSSKELAWGTEERQGFTATSADVMCCIKAYMRDVQLQQEPMQTLSASQTDQLTTAGPTDLVAYKPLCATDIAGYLKHDKIMYMLHLAN
jgi:hypothetical protein